VASYAVPRGRQTRQAKQAIEANVPPDVPWLLRAELPRVGTRVANAARTPSDVLVRGHIARRTPDDERHFTTMHSRIHTLLRTLAIATTLATAGAARASDTNAATPCPPAAKTPQAQAAGPVAKAVATAPAPAPAPAPNGFAGTIVDLSCDVVRLAGGNARCDAGEHHFALRMDGERRLRALEVAGSTPVADALHTGTLTGKEVCVTGEASPNGVLRVTGIHPLG